MTKVTEALARRVLDAGLPYDAEGQCVAPVVRRFVRQLHGARWSSPQARARGLRRLIVAALGSLDVVDNAEFTRRVVNLVIQWCVPTALRAAAQCHAGEQRARMLRAADLCEREPTRASAMEARATYTATFAATDTAAYAAHAAADAAAFAAHATTYIDADGVAAHIEDAASHAAVDAAHAAAKAAAAIAAATAYAANVARNDAVALVAYDEVLETFVERVVRVLCDMGSPGMAYLYLTEH